MLALFLLCLPPMVRPAALPVVAVADATDAKLRQAEGQARIYLVEKDSGGDTHEGRTLYEVKGRDEADHYTVWLRADRDQDVFRVRATVVVIRHASCHLHEAFTEYRLVECGD